MNALCIALLWPVKVAAEVMPWLCLPLSSFAASVHSFAERLLKVLDVRPVVQAVYSRELLLAQHTKVMVALRTSEHPNQCMHEPGWKLFCI